MREISETAAAHPEEMRATIEVEAGGSVAFRATARATPAGLIAAAVLAAAVLVPAIWIARGVASRGSGGAAQGDDRLA